MNIQGIYHVWPENYQLIKDLGFTHAGLSSDYPQDHNLFLSCVKEAHNKGLHVIVAPKFYIFNKPAGIWVSNIPDAKQLLEKLKHDLCMRCLVYLPDEPNLSRSDMTPDVMLALHTLIRNIIPQCSTVMVLGWTRSYEGYQNVSDIVGFDFYKPFWPDIWTTAKLIAKIKWFQMAHNGPLMAVPGIKYGADHIKRQARFWKLLGIKDFFWYSFTPDMEVPKWFDKDLAGLTEIQKALLRANQ